VKKYKNKGGFCLPQSATKRFWEVDFLRGLAVVMMIIYHLLFNLVFFGEYQYDLFSGFWFYFQQVTASLFIFLAGVALTLSYARTAPGITRNTYLRFFRRGLKVFFWGLVITAVTWFFLGEGFVVFGILHFIGLAIILAYPFLKYPVLSLPAAIFCLLTGNYLGNLRFGFSWLLWLGFFPEQFYTVDYFPLLPWFGVFLAGIFFGKRLYPGYRRAFCLPDFSGFPPVRVFAYLGRHSLVTYLLHQPLLLVLLAALGVIELFV